MNESAYSVNSTALKPKMNKFVIPGVIALVVLAVIGAAVYIRKDSPQPVNPNLPTEAAVSITNDGFEPSEVTIEVGSAVRWTNQTTNEQVSVNSTDHPDHKNNPELNLGEVPKDSTVVHIFNTPGEYTYHDHFNPERTGTIIVR